MDEKITVLVKVDPSQQTVIEPFADRIAEAVPLHEGKGGITGSGTGSNVDGTPDADVDIDW